LHFLFDWDFAAAEKEFKRALTLNPGYITTHYWYSSCLVGVGREAEALAQDQQTLEKDPLSVLANAHYAWTLVGLRRYDAAIQQIQATLKLDPNFAIAYRLLGQCYTQLQRHEQAVEAFQKAIDLSQAAPSMLAWLGYAFGRGGRRAEAEKVMTKLQEQSKSIYVRAFLFALVRIGLGDQAGALHWLQKAREEHDFWLQWLATDAAFDTLRSDRRFGQLLKSAGAPQAAPLQARPRVRTHPHPPGLAARAAVVS
jgi:serine/threonine-protein kinase